MSPQSDQPDDIQDLLGDSLDQYGACVVLNLDDGPLVITDNTDGFDDYFPPRARKVWATRLRMIADEIDPPQIPGRLRMPGEKNQEWPLDSMDLVGRPHPFGPASCSDLRDDEIRAR